MKTKFVTACGLFVILVFCFAVANAVFASETLPPETQTRFEMVRKTIASIARQDQVLADLKTQLEIEQQKRDVMQHSLDQDVEILLQSGYEFDWASKELKKAIPSQ